MRARGREDQHARAAGHLLALEDRRRHLQVVQPAVGAGADDDLVDLRARRPASTGLTLSTVCGQAICGSSVGRRRSRSPGRRPRPASGPNSVERVRHAGLLAQVAHGLLVGRARCPTVAPASTDMLQSTRRPEVDMLPDGLAVELDHLEVRALGGELADQVQDQVLGPDARRERAVHHHLDRRRAPRRSATLPRAQTAAISVAPMPKAKAPSAPWLVVWLSVPTTT